MYASRPHRRVSPERSVPAVTGTGAQIPALPHALLRQPDDLSPEHSDLLSSSHFSARGRGVDRHSYQ